MAVEQQLIIRSAWLRALAWHDAVIAQTDELRANVEKNGQKACFGGFALLDYAFSARTVN